MRTMDDLTERQRAFVMHYTTTPGAIGNAAEAARQAGYSQKSAKEIGSQLLHLPHIRDAIDAANREQLSGRIATKAVALLERVIEDEAAPMRDRVAAAKTVLDRGGYVPPSVAERAQTNVSEKPLSEMTREELASLIASEKAAIVALERTAQVGQLEAPEDDTLLIEHAA